MAPGVQNDAKRVAQGSKTMQKGRPAVAKQGVHCIAGWTARGCGGMKVERGETTAGGLQGRCRPTARKLQGDLQGICKGPAGAVLENCRKAARQGNCRETARGLVGNLREMCEGIAGNLKEDWSRTARALQEICRALQGNC